MASIWDPIYGWIDSLTGNQQTAPTPTPAPPMPTPTATPGSPSQPLGTTLTNNPITTAASGAVNNIHSGSAAALAAARRAAGALTGAGQQISDEGAVEGGNPAVAQPVSSGLNPAPSLPQPNYHMPWPRAQVPPGAPQAAAPPAAGGGGQQPYGSPWDPQGTGYAAAQRLQNPWDPQGAGWQAAQRLAAQQPPVQGALASQAPSSPFTMVLRPNAPAGQSGGRGGGGTPLATALDLSGWRPQARATARAAIVQPRLWRRARVCACLSRASARCASGRLCRASRTNWKTRSRFINGEYIGGKRNRLRPEGNSIDESWGGYKHQQSKVGPQ